MKILVTGASGLLGVRVARLALKKHAVVAAYSSNPIEVKGAEARKLDITNREQVFGLVREVQPEAIIHCAAMTNVDDCEKLPEKAFAVNGYGTENLAMAARELGARFVCVSTDYVFDGEKGAPYEETDSVNPVSYYGKSKLKGEVGARVAKKWAVGRVSVLYGWNAPHQHANFVTWVINKLKAKEKITLLTDQFTSPTLADNAAEALLKMAETEKSGVFNTSGSSCINRFDFGKEIADVFELDSGLIARGKSDAIKWLAKRPANSCLSVKKTEEELGVKMISSRKGLEFMKVQLKRNEADGWKL